MNGKKFVIGFVIATAIIGTVVSYWMKHAYDTRPKPEASSITAPETK